MKIKKKNKIAGYANGYSYYSPRNFFYIKVTKYSSLNCFSWHMFKQQLLFLLNIHYAHVRQSETEIPAVVSSRAVCPGLRGIFY